MPVVSDTVRHMMGWPAPLLGDPWHHSMLQYMYVPSSIVKTKIILNLHLSQWHLSTILPLCICTFKHCEDENNFESPLEPMAPLYNLTSILPSPLFPPSPFPSPPSLPLLCPSSLPLPLLPLPLLPPPLPFRPPIPFPLLSLLLPPLLLCLSPFLFSTSLPICSYISASELVLVDTKQVLMMITI